MTKRKLIILTIAVALLAGCKKDDTKNDPPSNANSFFIEGKGLRKIHEVNHASSGNLSGFGSANMMLSGQTLDWVFGWYSSINSATSYQPYRRRINITTGDTLANPGIPAGNPVIWLVSPSSYYFYANGTNQLYWLGATSLIGEPAGLPFSVAVAAKVYDNGQVFSYNATSGYTGFSMGQHTKPVSITYRNNGVVVDTNYLVRNNQGLEMIRCMDMEMRPNGEVLMFVATGDSIQVRRFRDNAVIAGIPCAALSVNYTNNTQPYCDLTTRRSADGSTITGFIFNNRVNPAQSTTFVYNTVTNTIQIKLNALPVNVAPLPVSYMIVFDDAGNVYYPNEPQFISGQAYGGITKQTPTGNTVLCERFLSVSSAEIEYIKAIGNKLFVVLHQGENTNAATGTKMTTYLLTVAE